MNLIDSKTYVNLAKSYAGECQAQVRYKFIEYGARNEGYTDLSNLIDDIVYQEFNHARMFYTHLQKASTKPITNVDIASGYPFKEKWNLLDNLKFAAEDEANEAEKIYPEYEKTAREEGFTEIADLYKNIIQIENCHKMFFTDIYNQMKSGTLYSKPQKVKWKCGGCGYEEVNKKAFEVCPVCLAKQGAVLLKIQDNA